MPKKSGKNNLSFNINWQESYGSIILGAIIIVIIGLLIANFIVKRDNGLNGEGVTTTQTQEQEEAAKQREHLVAKGDSLSKISNEYYGTMDLWPTLAEINGISNPNVIYEGTRIKVPPMEVIQETATEVTATTYDVVEGDTLFKIAEKVYGDGSAWGRISSANNVGSLPNGNPLIFAGSTLTIPR